MSTTHHQVSLVINFDLPDKDELYIHCSGCSGVSGRKEYTQHLNSLGVQLVQYSSLGGPIVLINFCYAGGGRK